MTDETANLMIEMLKRIRASQERMELDIQDIKTRMTSLEITVAQMANQLAAQSLRLDRLEERISRIERRLDLVEHH